MQSVQRFKSWPFLWLRGLTLSLSIFLGGYSLGSANILGKRFQANFGWTDAEAVLNLSLLVALLPLGFLVGTTMTMTLSNRIGRFKCIILAQVISNVGFILVVIVNYGVALLGRFTIGIGVSMNYSLAPLFLTELTPKEARPQIGASTGLGLTFGFFSVYLLGYLLPINNHTDEISWRIVAMFPIISNTVQMILLCLFVSESPKYLFCVKNDEVKTLECLKKIYKDDFIKSAIDELRKEKSIQKKYTWGEFFQIFWRQQLLGLALATCHQFGGIAAINFFSSKIFILSGMDTAQATFYMVIQGVSGFAGACLVTLLTKKFSIRHILIVGIFLLTLVNISMGVTLGAGAYDGSSVLVFIYCVIFFATIGPGLFMVSSQILPPFGAGITFMCNGLNMFTAGFTFLYIKNSSIGAGGAFYIYAAVCFSVFIYCYIFLPDIRGKGFEEITSLFQAGRPGKIKPSAKDPSMPIVHTEMGQQKFTFAKHITEDRETYIYTGIHQESVLPPVHDNSSFDSKLIRATGISERTTVNSSYLHPQN
jgi:MFS family permease